MKNNKRLLPVLGLMAFMVNGDNYAAAPLLLRISGDLAVPLHQAVWSVTAYMLAFGLFTLIFGPLSDRYGKVRVINTAALGTAIFSILGGFSFNLSSLIFFRAMNGIFAAGIFPVTMALVGQSFDDSQRHKALGKVMGMMFLGAATSTAIGGALAHYGSWRLVYIAYGIGELVIALIMLRVLDKDAAIVEKLNFVAAYKEPLSSFRFLRLVTVIFFVGFAVFGSFPYSGKLLQDLKGASVFQIGLILSLFGAGTVLGGRIAPKLKSILKKSFLVVAGVVGSIGLFIISQSSNLILISIGLFCFGLAFVFLQSTLISTAQAKLPKMRGTAMSLASFNMFVGGAFGTLVNGRLLQTYDVSRIFFISAFLLLAVGLVASVFVSRFEQRWQANPSFFGRP